MDQRDVFVVVDGNSVAHRAWHAYRRSGLTDSAGRDVTVRYGFCTLLVAVLDKVVERYGRSPMGVLVAFDAPGNWRRQEYPDYKAQRPPTDPELRRQLDELPGVLDTLGVTSFSIHGFEADDVCASAAAAATAAGGQCVVVTSDRDAVSLVDDTVIMLRLGNGMNNATWLDPAAVETTFGVPPQRYLLLAALRGDTSDNLAGVKGVGPQKAAALAARFGSFDDMLAAPQDVATLAGPRSVAALAESAESVRRNLHLMAVRRDLDVPVLDSGLRMSAEELYGAAQKLELPGLAHRISIAFSAGGTTVPALEVDVAWPGTVVPVRTLFDHFEEGSAEAGHDELFGAEPVPHRGVTDGDTSDRNHLSSGGSVPHFDSF